MDSQITYKEAFLTDLSNKEPFDFLNYTERQLTQILLTIFSKQVEWVDDYLPTVFYLFENASQEEWNNILLDIRELNYFDDIEEYINDFKLKNMTISKNESLINEESKNIIEEILFRYNELFNFSIDEKSAIVFFSQLGENIYDPYKTKERYRDETQNIIKYHPFIANIKRLENISNIIHNNIMQVLLTRIKVAPNSNKTILREVNHEKMNLEVLNMIESLRKGARKYDSFFGKDQTFLQRIKNIREIDIQKKSNQLCDDYKYNSSFSFESIEKFVLPYEEIAKLALETTKKQVTNSKLMINEENERN